MLLKDQIEGTVNGTCDALSRLEAERREQVSRLLTSEAGRVQLAREAAVALKWSPALSKLLLVAVVAGWLERDGRTPNRSGDIIIDTLKQRLGLTEIAQAGSHQFVATIDVLFQRDSLYNRQFPTRTGVLVSSRVSGAGDQLVTDLRTELELAVRQVVLSADLHAADDSFRPALRLPAGDWQPSLSLRLPARRTPTVRDEAANFTIECRATRYRGFESEHEQLGRFLAEPDPILWMIVHGAGGAGKSRMAQEYALAQLGTKWTCGFLQAEIEGQPWERWQPHCDMLLIVDDVSLGSAEGLGKCIATLSDRAASFQHKVRFLLLERQANSGWFDEFAPPRSGLRRRLQGLQFDQPYEMPALSSELLVEITKEVFDEQGGREEDFLRRKGAIQDVFAQQPEMARPLIAMLIGYVGAHGQGRSWWPTRRRRVAEKDFLEGILEPERRGWEERGADDATLGQIACAAIVGGIRQAEWSAWGYTEQEFERYVRATRQASRNVAEALKPDVIAEHYVLNHLGRLGDAQLRATMQLCWKRAPKATRQFLERIRFSYGSNEDLDRIVHRDTRPPDVNRDEWFKFRLDRLLDTGRVDEYFEIKAELVRERATFVPTANLAYRLIARAPNFESARATMQTLKDNGYVVDVQHYNVLIGKAEIEMVDVLLHEMRSNGIAENARTYALLMDKENPEKFRALLDEMKRKGHLPDHGIYRRIVRSGSRELVQETLDAMLAQKYRFSHVLTHELVNRAIAADRTSEFLSLETVYAYLESVERSGLIVRMSLLGVLADRGDAALCKKIVTDLRARKRRVSLQLWTTLLEKSPEAEIEAVLSSMSEDAVEKDDVIYTTLMQREDGVNAERWFNELEELGAADAVAYQVMMDRSGSLAGAERWLERMCAKNIQPTAYHFSTLIRLATPEEFRGVIDKLRHRQSDWDLFIYNQILAHLGSGGLSIAEKTQLFDEIVESGLGPNAWTFEGVIRSLDDFHEASRWFLRMSEWGLEPTAKTIAHIVKLSPTIEMAIQVHREELAKKERPAFVVLDALLRRTTLARDFNLGFEIFEEMVSHGYQPSQGATEYLMQVAVEAQARILRQRVSALGLPVTDRLVNIYLEVIRKSSPNKVEKEWKREKKSDPSLQSDVYNTATRMLAASGPREVEQILGDFVAGGGEPDAYLYSIAIERARGFEAALKHFVASLRLHPDDYRICQRKMVLRATSEWMRERVFQAVEKSGTLAGADLFESLARASQTFIERRYWLEYLIIRFEPDGARDELIGFVSGSARSAAELTLLVELFERHEVKLAKTLAHNIVANIERLHSRKEARRLARKVREMVAQSDDVA